MKTVLDTLPSHGIALYVAINMIRGRDISIIITNIPFHKLLQERYYITFIALSPPLSL